MTMEKINAYLSVASAFIEKHHKLIVLVLAVLNVFGVTAPETATGLRDALLGLAP